MKISPSIYLIVLSIFSSLNGMQSKPVIDDISNNTTSLWRAVYNNGQNTDENNLALIRELIQKGASPNIDLPKNVSSPMELAIIRLTQRELTPHEANRRLEVLKILLSKGDPLKNSRRYDLGILVKNMPTYAHKKDLVELMRKYGLAK